MANHLFKDAALNALAEHGNVAQFVSYGPDLVQRFAWIRELAPNETLGPLPLAVEALLERSPERSVNVRSYHPEHPKSREFVYGLQTVADVVGKVTQLAAAGLFTIVNETVDIHDGGVSGVIAGDALEFAPDATPRCVEEPGTAALPREIGRRLLKLVYGFDSGLDFPKSERVEFSLHPRRRGFRNGHTLLWEVESLVHEPSPPEVHWPNNFSGFLGDKAYGLLVADAIGLSVPRTVVVPRRVAPFHFGTETGTGEVWIRTSPNEQQPGFFTTEFGWRDPFALLASEDPNAQVASVLSQQAVDAKYSGAFADSDDQPEGLFVEGVRGRGDAFMLGERPPENVPQEVLQAVESQARIARQRLGRVRGEWVFDGRVCWIVQLHRARSAVSRSEIFPGTPRRYREFAVEEGLQKLRALVAEVKGKDEGIVVIGRVGVTSHFGDVLRQAEIPSYLAESA